MTTLTAPPVGPKSSAMTTVGSTELWLKALKVRILTIEGRNYLREGGELTAAERSSITKGIENLTIQLSPGHDHRKAVAVALARLLGAFPGERMDDTTKRVRMDAYQTALSDLPAWAIHDTVDAIIIGKIGDGRFAPTPPQLGTLVRNGPIKKFQVELQLLQSLRDAQVLPSQTKSVSDKERQFVGDGLADLKADLGRLRDERAELSRARALTELAETNERFRVRDCKQAGIDPGLGITSVLAKKLKEFHDV